MLKCAKVVFINHNTADQEQDDSLFVKPHSTEHIVAIVVYVEVDENLLGFLRGNTPVFLLPGLSVIRVVFCLCSDLPAWWLT